MRPRSESRENVRKYTYAAAAVMLLYSLGNATSAAPLMIGPKYTISALDTLGGDSNSAQSINNAGQVTGWSQTADGNRHAFLYSNGSMMNLGTLAGGSNSVGASLSNSAQIVGNSGINEFGVLYSEVMQASFWENGAVSSLGALNCPCNFNQRYGTSIARAINDIGQVVGDSETIRGEWVRHAFLWQNGTMQDIGGGAGDWSISQAFAINNQGQVVGDFAENAGRLTSYERRAFIWQENIMQDLGTLPGHSSSTALAINDAGQVVGWSGSFDGAVSRGFLWDGTGMHDLGTLPDYAHSQALGVNLLGQVVGWSGTTDRSSSHAVLWQNGIIYDLNELLIGGSGWELNESVSINNNGQITGSGLLNGQTRAFILTPIQFCSTLSKKLNRLSIRLSQHESAIYQERIDNFRMRFVNATNPFVVFPAVLHTADLAQ